MKPAQNQKQFSELAGWVIAETLKAGASACKVSISRQRFVEINYRENKPEVIKEAITQGLSLDVYKDNRFASQSTPDLRKETLGGFISQVLDTSAIVEEDPMRTLPDPKYYQGRKDIDLQICDPGQSALTPEMRHEMARQVEKACLARGGERVISVEAGTSDGYYEEFIKTSNGFEGAVESTDIWAGAEATLQDEGDRRPAGGNWMGGRYLADLPAMQTIGELAADRALELMGGKKISTETLPVIIENRSVGRVLSGFLSAMTGRNIQQKRSFLADKLNTKVGSEVFNLVDDPHIARGMGSRLYDGDGFPAVKHDLVSRGMLNSFLVDWYYSRKLGWEPTTGWPANLILQPGTESVNDMLGRLNRCVVITGFIGGNSNSTTGDFSVGITGRLYEKGEFVQSVAEMNIADNHLKFWDRLIAAGNDPWTYSSYRLPSLLFDQVVIAGL